MKRSTLLARLVTVGGVTNVATCHQRHHCHHRFSYLFLYFIFFKSKKKVGDSGDTSCKPAWILGFGVSSTSVKG